MRLFTKFFLVGMLVFGLAFSVSGYFLLHYSMESSLAREAEFALKQYQYDKFTVQSAMLAYTDVSIVLDGEGGFSLEDEAVFSIWGSLLQGQLYVGGHQVQDITGITGVGLAKSLFGSMAEEISSPVAFYAEGWEPIFSEIEGIDSSFLGNLSAGQHFYQFCDTPEGGCVLVGGVLDYGDFSTVESMWSIEKENQDAAAPSPEAGEGNGAENSLDTAGIGQAAMDTRGAASAGQGAAEEGDVGRKSWPGAAGAGTQEGYGKAGGEWIKAVGRGETEGLAMADGGGGSVESQDGSGKIYFVTQWEIGKAIGQQQTLRQYFIRCYLIAMAAGMLLVGVLSALLTEPLKRMSRAAGRMAEGYYEERLTIARKDEIGQLAGSFNQMAGAVEEKVGELSRAAREKEDFVANFAHELKTPLTSIIGYADTIYQKELSRDEVRRASWHIWNEGMRLEALSFKLMELTVLGRQEFTLVEMPADELLRDVAEGLSPPMEEKKIALRLEAQQAYVKVDYDLLKTLLINLVDNSVKAGAFRIGLSGQVKEGKYLVQVRDDGCGMEEEVLSRITEAFYMIDKARSRKQHGAGLGLALADRIARVHGSVLTFESRKGQGTKVSFFLGISEDAALGTGGASISGTGKAVSLEAGQTAAWGKGGRDDGKGKS